MKKKISVSEAASLMGKSIQFVRIGLQRGAFNFGSAVKLSSRWSYHISPELFNEYLNGKSEEQNFNER